MGFERVLRDLEKILLLIQNLYIKLDPFERGPLSYIAGYIVSKLYQKSKNNSELQALFIQALKSTGQDNEFILARSRGGLVAPSRHLMAHCRGS